MSAVAAASPGPDVASHEAYAERLYERHHRAIYGFCLKQLRRREDADDAVQMTFIYVLLSLRRGIVPQLELPWLFTIARNVCSTRRRSGMRRGEYESPQDLDSIQDKLAVPERADVATTEDITAALRAIPEKQRKALLLREWRGLSYEEIGTELGLSQAATEALLFRARQNVARRLDERIGVKTLQSLPLISFLRNLFKTAAAKTAAIGAGAALAVVSVPAAVSDARRPAQPRHHPAPVAGAAARTTSPRIRVHAAHVRPDVAARTTARVSAPRRVIPYSPPAPEAEPVTPGASAASAPPSPPAESASPPSGSPAPSTVAGPPVSEAATNTVAEVVDTVSDAGSSLGLPPVSVSLPETPQLPTLPVQTPTVPSPHLP